jgi:hypothetical protein
MMELRDAVKWIADEMYSKRMGGSNDYRMHEEINMTARIYNVPSMYVRERVSQYIINELCCTV